MHLAPLARPNHAAQQRSHQLKNEQLKNDKRTHNKLKTGTEPTRS